MGRSSRRTFAATLRFGAAVIAVASVATFLGAQPSRAANCLYPDKATGSPPSYACLKPIERALVEFRKFRAELTVAALRCNQQSVYNDVVLRHQGEMVTRGKALGAAFRRLYGAAAADELNRYVTHLTNRASIGSLGVRDYCRSMSRVFAEALKAPVRGLMAFVGDESLIRAAELDRPAARAHRAADQQAHTARPSKPAR